MCAIILDINQCDKAKLLTTINLPAENEIFIIILFLGSYTSLVAFKDILQS